MGEHWYGQDGSSQYDADLRKARKNGYVPSVTTVLSVIDKPALTNWLIEQAVMGALTLPKIDGESDAAFLARIKIDGRASAKAAAEEGSRIHDAIEHSFIHGPEFVAVRQQYAHHVMATQAELTRLFPDVHDWISEQSFAHPLGFGGKVDLHSPSTGICPSISIPRIVKKLMAAGRSSTIMLTWSILLIAIYVVLLISRLRLL